MRSSRLRAVGGCRRTLKPTQVDELLLTAKLSGFSPSNGPMQTSWREWRNLHSRTKVTSLASNLTVSVRSCPRTSHGGSISKGQTRSDADSTSRFSSFCSHRLISSGVSVRTVAGRLGHSDASMTFQVYSHFVAATDREAAELIGSFVSSALTKRSAKRPPKRNSSSTRR